MMKKRINLLKRIKRKYPMIRNKKNSSIVC